VRYLVLGAGLQGLAIAYDLATHGEAERITLLDADADAVTAGIERLARLAPAVRVEGEVQRLRGVEAEHWMRGHDVAVSAMPYRFNVGLAQAAVRAGVSFCDLGGNTELVRAALELDGAARAAGIAIVPDCGLAPGLANELAAIAMGEVEGARHVKIRCGGLPAAPTGPLGYRLLFSIEGLTNEYRGQAVVLRDGRIERVEAFTGCESFRGPPELGQLEAFHTSGGSSTAPWTFKDRLESYEYKTVRYPGHFEKVRAMIDLGLLDLDPVDVDGKSVVPRALFHAVARPRLDTGPKEDIAFLRVDCTDAHGRGVRYEMLQRYDPKTGFTAMEQSTGYPAAATAHALARGEIEPGAHTPERCGFKKPRLTALRQRGLICRPSDAMGDA